MAHQESAISKTDTSAIPTDATAYATADGAPTRCVCFDISADYGHFAKPQTTSPVQTFGVPPRTTVIGMVAAAFGFDRDSYYDLFSQECCEVGIELTSPVERLTLARNNLTTKGSGGMTKGAKIAKLENLNKRQQRTMEYLRDPTYRLYIAHTDQALLEDFATLLRQRHERYPISMGKSEHLARVELDGIFDIERRSSNGPVTISSVIPRTVDLVPKPEARYVSERTPAAFTMSDDGRISDGWRPLLYDPSATPLTVRDVTYCIVNNTHILLL